jgi:putative PIN family toxin of toxin-antitoxin system
MKPSVVFDCMVIVQTFLNAKGPAGACDQLVLDGTLELHLSLDLIVEVRDDMSRPKLTRRFPAMTAATVDPFLTDLARGATFWDQVPHAFSLPRDPKDEPYLNLAIASRSRYLVSRDKDLLDLMDTPSFRSAFPELTILDPSALLCLLRQQDGNDG